MKSFKTFIEERNFGYEIHVLVESLDKPYELTNITSTIHPENLKHCSERGYSEPEFYTCNDEPGHGFFVAKRNGSHEIHHQYTDSDGKVVHDKNVLDKVPSKFVSTAFTLMDDKLLRGHPVRVIGSSDHVENYHRLVKLVAKRRGYSVSEKEPYHEDDGFDKPRQSFMVHPAAGKGIITFPFTHVKKTT